MLANFKSPVEPRSYEIQIRKSDGNTLCVVEFFNLSPKIVTTLEFTLRCYDSFGESVGTPPNNEVKAIFRGINVDAKTSFGQNNSVILSDHPLSRKVQVVVNKVMFSDGTRWDYDDNDLVEVIVDKIQGEELKNLKAVVGEDAICYAKKELNYWLCVCGRANHHEIAMCLKCERHREHVISNFYNEAQINEAIDLIKAKKIEEDRILQEQAQERNRKLLEQEEMRKVQIKNYNNRVKLMFRKYAVYSFPILVMVFVFTIFLNGLSYRQIAEALEVQDVERAIEVYNNMSSNKQKEKVRELISSEIKNVKKSYLGDTMNFDDSIILLERYAKFKPLDSECEEVIIYIRSYEQSAELFESIEYLMIKGKYKEVIETVEQIIVDYVYYDKALLYSDEAKMQYENELLAEVELMIQGGNLIEAYNLLKENLAYTTEGEQITNATDNSLLLASEQIIEEARSLQGAGNYQGAIELLNKNIAYNFGNNISQELRKIENDYLESQIKSIKSRITVSYDEFDREYEIVARGYDPKYVNIGRNINIEPRLYFSERPDIALIVGFEQKSWIFFETVIFNVDGKKYEWELDFFDRETQIGFGSISEWFYVIHSDIVDPSTNIKNLQPLLDDIVKAEKTTIRFRGDGVRDHQITKSELQTIKDMWELYNLLNDKPALFELLK